MERDLLYKIPVLLERREDGGLRAWCEEIPELVLSHGDADAVLADLPRALAVILSERLGGEVSVAELRLLSSEPLPPSDVREFAARLAA